MIENHSALNIIRVIKLRRMKYARHTAYMWEMITTCKCWSENLQETHSFGGISVDEKTILNSS
jgi:hypothetical protein